MLAKAPTLKYFAMKTKTHKLIFLLVVLVIGVAYIGYDKGFWVCGNKTKVIQAGTQNPLDIKPDKVFFLSIKNKGGSFSVERVNKYSEKVATTGFFNTINPQWTLMDPEGAVANQNLISDLIDKLASMQIHGVISKQEQDSNSDAASGTDGLKNYGFDNPELTIIVSDTTEHVLEFGELNFISGRRYFRRKGDDNIYLVDSALFNDFDLLVGQVRESTPYQVDINNVTEIVATVPFVKTLIRLVKESDGEWYVEPNGETSNRFIADKEVVERVLTSTLNFTVNMFVDQAMGEKEFQLLNLSPADLAIEVAVASGTDSEKQTTIKLPKILFGRAVIAQYGDEIEIFDPQFGKKEGDLQKAYFTKLESTPHVYKLSSMAYRALTGDGEVFRDRKPLRKIERYTIRDVEILSPDSRIYSKDDRAWADMRIEALLKMILDFQVITYLENDIECISNEAANKNSAEIILYGRDKAKIASFAIKGQVGSGNAVVSDDAPRYVAIQIGDNAKPRYAIAGAHDAREIMSYTFNKE